MEKSFRISLYWSDLPVTFGVFKKTAEGELSASGMIMPILNSVFVLCRSFELIPGLFTMPQNIHSLKSYKFSLRSTFFDC